MLDCLNYSDLLKFGQMAWQGILHSMQGADMPSSYNVMWQDEKLDLRTSLQEIESPVSSLGPRAEGYMN